MPSPPAVSNGRDGSSILWVGEFHCQRLKTNQLVDADLKLFGACD